MNSLIVVEQAVGAQERAESTRKHLEELAAKLAQNAVGELVEPTADELKAYKAEIRPVLQEMLVSKLNRAWNAYSEHGQRRLLYAFNEIRWCLGEVSVPKRDDTAQYAIARMEVGCSIVRKWLHDNGINPKDYSTDTWYYAAYVWQNHIPDDFYYDVKTAPYDNRRWCLFIENGEPMLFGMETQEAYAGMRCVRRRLGSVLQASNQYSEGSVRNRVEAAKGKISGDVVVLAYPNDTAWAPLYIDNDDCRSCMAGESYDGCGEYHPVDAYCSAYYGAGDNGLALFVTQNGNGLTTGRGIYNCKTGKIVRWYGIHSAIRAMRNVGISDNSEALEGSWLALLIPAEDSSRFVHPYVDGDYSCGNIDFEARRVYLKCGGEYDLCDTDGYSYHDNSDRVYCEFTGRHVSEDYAQWLEYQQCWMADWADSDYTCDVTGEPIPPLRANFVWDVHEEQAVVCDAAYHELFRCGREVNGWKSKYGRYPDQEVIVQC